MDQFFCFGKKGFCDNHEACKFCEFSDGEGGIYIEDFNKLESRDFPITIWDSTGLKSRTMNKQEFNELKKYLENLVDKAYQEKKKRICKYMIEIGKLEDK